VRTPKISGNAPVMAGTRIRVVSIRRLHEDGYTVGEILAEYPHLTEADMSVALQAASG